MIKVMVKSIVKYSCRNLGSIYNETKRITNVQVHVRKNTPMIIVWITVSKYGCGIILINIFTLFLYFLLMRIFSSLQRSQVCGHHLKFKEINTVNISKDFTKYVIGCYKYIDDYWVYKIREIRENIKHSNNLRILFPKGSQGIVKANGKQCVSKLKNNRKPEAKIVTKIFIGKKRRHLF